MVYELPAAGSIFRSYNALLDRAAERDDLEALVLLHQDAEIVDADLCAKVRAALSDPEVAVVGCVGALDVRSIAWWEGSVTLASFINRYEEHGGGDLHSFSWTWEDAPPWAQTRRGGDAGRLRARAGAVGRAQHPLRRVARPLPRLRPRLLPPGPRGGPEGRDGGFPRDPHREIEMFPDPEEWIEAHIAVAEKWDGRMPGIGTAPGSGASGRCAPRPSATPPRRSATRRCSSSRRAPASSSAASPRRARACPGDSARRCGAVAVARRRRPSRDDRVRLAIVDPEAYRRFARRGIRRAAEPDSVVHAFAAVGTWRAATTCCSTPPRVTTTSRRSCSWTRTPRSPTPASAPASARRCATRTSPSRARRAPGTSGRSRGGRAG